MYTEVATSFIPPHLTRHHSNNSSQYNFLHLLIAIVFYGRLLFLFPLFFRQKCLRNICFHDQKESVCLLSQKHSSTSILKNISSQSAADLDQIPNIQQSYFGSYISLPVGDELFAYRQHLRWSVMCRLIGYWQAFPQCPHIAVALEAEGLSRLQKGQQKL